LGRRVGLLVALVVVTMAGPAVATRAEAIVTPGGVVITGHDPDFHAHLGGNATGARDTLQRSVAYVTNGLASPRMLLVTDLRDPGSGYSDPRLGVTDAGFTYDTADYGSGTAGVLDLHTVHFNNYDVIVVASDFGGWLHQDEVDVLISRENALFSFVNNGGGIVALSEGGANGLVANNPFGFLPFVVSHQALGQAESGFSVTSLGTAMGLTDSDVNGNASHSIFGATGGLGIVDHDAAGNIITLAERGQRLTTGGVALHPKADPALVATWKNLNGTSPNISKIVIQSTGTTGGITVDAFGNCNPSFCEWGRAPATIYGTTVASTRGRQFQVNIDQGFARKVLFGKLTTSPSTGPRLTVSEFAAFTDGSGRKNYAIKEVFATTDPGTTTTDATPVSDYPSGDPPLPVAGMVGTWTNTNAATHSIVELDISAAGDGSLLVHELGACSPSPCENGTVGAISYGSSTVAAHGAKFIAPYDFGFARQQLAASFNAHTGRLTVMEYFEFTDGSGRSNFELTETFVQS
jgi:hypothetical protein